MAAGRPVIFIGPGGSEAAKTIRESECGYVLENATLPDCAQPFLT